jgi:hypothetical protein
MKAAYFAHFALSYTIRFNRTFVNSYFKNMSYLLSFIIAKFP